jgi:hypothetical protein
VIIVLWEIDNYYANVGRSGDSMETPVGGVASSGEDRLYVQQ